MPRRDAPSRAGTRRPCRAMPHPTEPSRARTGHAGLAQHCQPCRAGPRRVSTCHAVHRRPRQAKPRRAMPQATARRPARTGLAGLAKPCQAESSRAATGRTKPCQYGCRVSLRPRLLLLLIDSRTQLLLREANQSADFHQLVVALSECAKLALRGFQQFELQFCTGEHLVERSIGSAVRIDDRVEGAPRLVASGTILADDDADQFAHLVAA